MPSASRRAVSGSFFVSPGSKRVFSSTSNALVREELAQPRGDRRHRERRVRALRPAEVRADGDLGGAALEEELERRQRGADARVVGDPPVLERDVQVGAHEDALARDVRVANRARPVHVTESSLPIRSTSRHE